MLWGLRFNGLMTRSISRRFFLCSAAGALVAPAAYAAPPTQSLRPVLRDDDFFRKAIPTSAELIAKANLNGEVAYAVADVEDGIVLEQRSGAQGMAPASVAKAITALYALDALGADHRFETRLIATGGITDGEVQGDLVLVGGADPTLDTDTLAQMAADLKDAGIRAVKGDFKVYDANLPLQSVIDAAQPDHVSYNPAVAGIALNFNRVHFEWKRGSDGYAVTMDGRSEKYRPAVAMAAMQVQDRSAPLYAYRDGGSRDNWSVAQPFLGSGGSRWLPVRKPGLYAGDIFATLAGAHGIRLRGLGLTDTVPAGDTVVTHTSAPLRDIMQDMLKYSTNLTAEMVGLSATIARGGTPTSLKQSAGMMNAWAASNLGMGSAAFVDHSGLGEDSRISARDMVAALVRMHGSQTLKPILKTVVMRDGKRRPMPDHPVRVEAKTGTLNFVSGLAGYMTTPEGRVMAFAIFAGDMPRRATLTRAQRERPDGGRAWNVRAKRLQQDLIERWAAYYVE